MYEGELGGMHCNGWGNEGGKMTNRMSLELFGKGCIFPNQGYAKDYFQSELEAKSREEKVTRVNVKR